MDLTGVVQIIQNLGFPIACCIALFYRNSKLEESHKQDLDVLRKSIDNNTRVMSGLIKEIEVLKEVVEHEQTEA